MDWELAASLRAHQRPLLQHQLQQRMVEAAQEVVVLQHLLCHLLWQPGSTCGHMPAPCLRIAWKDCLTEHIQAITCLPSIKVGALATLRNIINFTQRKKTLQGVKSAAQIYQGQTL